MNMRLAVHALSVRDRLHAVSAVLRPGQVTAICGPNGAGKSTLLACLAGLLAPGEGNVLLDGAPLADLAPRARARMIGFLPQNGEVAWDISVEALAGLGRLPWGGAPEKDRAAVAGALASLDLEELAARPVSTLSGGEKARALLARVLAGEPCWVLADEPLASLDIAHQLALISHLRGMAASGVGVVLVIHDLALAMNHADRVLVLDHGALVANGPPGEALDADVIERFWGVRAHWLGEPGVRALVMEPASRPRLP